MFGSVFVFGKWGSESRSEIVDVRGRIRFVGEFVKFNDVCVVVEV